MRRLNSYRMKLLVVGIVFFSAFGVPQILSGQTTETTNNDHESSEVIITIAGHDHRYQPRPDLGYVVLAQSDSDARASIHRDLSLFTQNEIRPIGGRGRQGLWIVESKQSSAQNEVVIKTLRIVHEIVSRFHGDSAIGMAV